LLKSEHKNVSEARGMIDSHGSTGNLFEKFSLECNYIGVHDQGKGTFKGFNITGFGVQGFKMTASPADNFYTFGDGDVGVQ